MTAGRPEIAVGIIVHRDASLLMIRRGHGQAGGRWSVPGGRVERGESAAQAVRELEARALQLVLWNGDPSRGALGPLWRGLRGQGVAAKEN